MTYPLLPSVCLMDGASTMAADLIGTSSQLQAFLQVYLNGGTNPYNGSQFPGFFTLTNANLYGGDWSVAWGPCVYVEPILGKVGAATNSMYVAFSPSLNTYVVCIAGTNPLSTFDWIYEDFDIFPNYAARWQPPGEPKLPFKADWKITPILPFIPAISAATATGISDVLTQKEMRDPNSGQYLGEFLKAKMKANATLIFAGHSLAAALAPTLALYLYPNPPAGWNNVFVLSLAGATPGNVGFSTAFGAAFPMTADSTSNWFWNVDYANKYDVVPHAWDKLLHVVEDEDSAGNYPSIWGVLQGPGWDTIGYAVSSAMEVGWFLAADYYSPIQQLWFTPPWGQFTGNPPTWSPLPTYTDASPLTTASELAAVIMAAHTDQYFKYFGVEPPPPIYKHELNTVSPQAAMLGKVPRTRPRRRTGGLKGLLTARRPPTTR